MTYSLRQRLELVRGKWRKTKRYLNTVFQSARLAKARILHDFAVKEKFLQLVGLTTDVVVTGVLIWAAIRWWGNPVGYGLTAALVMYYLRSIIELIRHE